MEATPQSQAPDTPADEHRPAEGSPEAYDDGEAPHDEPAHDEPVGRRERETYGLQIPMARIKRAMKDATDVKAVSAEASYLVARATELLLEHLTSSSAERMHTAQRSELLYGDVAASVKQWPAAKFLSDIVPQQVTIASLLQQVQREDALDLANGVSHAPLDVAAMQEDAQLAAAAEAPAGAAEPPAPAAELPAPAAEAPAANGAAGPPDGAPAHAPAAVPAAGRSEPAQLTQLAGVTGGSDAAVTAASGGVAPAGAGLVYPSLGTAPVPVPNPAAAAAPALGAGPVPGFAPAGAHAEGSQMASGVAPVGQDVPMAEAAPLQPPPMQMY